MRKRFDSGVPGGQYMVAGTLVNANGEPIEPAEVSLHDLKVSEIRALLAEAGVEVPSSVRKKGDLIALLEEAENDTPDDPEGDPVE